MQVKSDIIRRLSPIEEAFTIMNDTYPLAVVCVLHLTSGPAVNVVEDSLDQLQQRHPLLQAGISKIKGRYYFEQLSPVRKIELKIVDRKEQATSRTIAEQALNTSFDKTGPLMKCWYLPDTGKGPCEIIICFHHAIIDGASARLLLHELLSILGGIELPGPAPMVTPDFPPAFKGYRLVKRLLNFTGRQAKEEWNYRKKGLAASIPAGSINATLSLQLSLEASRKLSVQAGRKGLGMNSVLLAAITHILSQHRYTIQETSLARAISFANFRSALKPPLERQELGCYISMMRLCVPITSEQSVWELARHMHRALFKAGRRREVLLMAIVSKYLIKAALRFQNARLGVTGLSFIGKLDLQPQYGTIRLHNVEAFITNNQLGPEISAFGKVLFGSISLNFTYLTSELSPEQARQVTEEVKVLLENMAELP